MEKLEQNLTYICGTALSRKTATKAYVQETATLLAKHSIYMYAVPSLVGDN